MRTSGYDSHARPRVLYVCTCMFHLWFYVKFYLFYKFNICDIIMDKIGHMSQNMKRQKLAFYLKVSNFGIFL